MREERARDRGLQLRGSAYYSRIVVPAALVQRIGKKEILKSLRTSNRTDAEALHLQEAARWAATLAEAVTRNLTIGRTVPFAR